MKICSRTINDPVCGTPDRYGWTCCGQPSAPPDTDRARMIRAAGLEAVRKALDAAPSQA